MYNLILVDAEGVTTTVHRMNVITGDYLTPRRLIGQLEEQVYHLVNMIDKDRPDKIIFDKNGHGYIFYYYFMERAKINKSFNVDSFGLITYEGRD